MGSEGREGSEGQSHKAKEKGGELYRGGAHEFLAKKGWMALFGYFCKNPRISSCATSDGAGLPT